MMRLRVGSVRYAFALYVRINITQISKIIAAKSVDGLAPFSIYSDLVIYIVNAVYHIVSGSPFRFVGSTYTAAPSHAGVCVTATSLRMAPAVRR